MMVNILCLEAIAIIIIAFIALMGALCICLTIVHIYIIVISREIENKQIFMLQKSFSN